MTFLSASRARLEDILAYRARHGWTFSWVSSAGSDFNRDFGAFTEQEREAGTGFQVAAVDEPIAKRRGREVLDLDAGEPGVKGGARGLAAGAALLLLVG